MKAAFKTELTLLCRSAARASASPWRGEAGAEGAGGGDWRRKGTPLLTSPPPGGRKKIMPRPAAIGAAYRRSDKVVLSVFLFLAATLFAGPAPARAGALRVCATAPDLGELARTVGGPAVDVTVFAKGPEDAHFVEARPSFIKALSRCGLYIQVGLELEVGYAPLLLQNSRNADIQRGAKGYLDASSAVTPLEVQTSPVDRSMGDVHPYGNPHYLLDPLNGLVVAGLIRDRLGELVPDRKLLFEENFGRFEKDLAAALVGPKLSARFEAAKLAGLVREKKLAAFLKEQKAEGDLGGWLGAVAPYAGTKVVADHNLWAYFTARFGLVVAAFLEPKPGVPPTTAHLREVVAKMNAEKIGVIFRSVYFDPRSARFVAEHTGARVAAVAHQSGAMPGTEGYLKMIDYDVREFLRAAGEKHE